MNQTEEVYLPGGNPRGRWMRLDTAGILKRLFFCEQALIIGQAGWLVSIPSFDIKTTLPRLFWEDAMTANALRERIFELHYPSRLMNVGGDSGLIDVIRDAANAPGPESYILSLAHLFAPALLSVYRAYLDQSDKIADGPTLRIMRIAAQEKEEHVATLNRFADEMLAAAPHRREEAEAWIAALGQRLDRVGGISLDEMPVPADRPPLPGGRAFKLSDVPLRDDRFYKCRFYWPNIIDPGFPYGEGMALQIRSAISHINEIWAVDAAATSLNAFAETLGWEFVFDAARWTYDESRHSVMGYDRLRQWGFEDREIPMGTYIYDSAKGKSPLYLLGMLSYFETKNIGKKKQRAKDFEGYHDLVSQHDMDFDWADETIHAHYGSHWLGILRKIQADSVPDFDTLRDECNRLVDKVISHATEEERVDIRRVADAMIQKAQTLSHA